MSDDIRIAAPYSPKERVEQVGDAFIKGTKREYAIVETLGYFALHVWEHANYHMETRISCLEAARGPLPVDRIVEQMKKEWKG